MKIVALLRRGPVLPCRAVSPVYQNLVLHSCHLCALHVPYCYGWSTFAFSPAISNDALCLFWSGMDPVLLVVQSLAALDLSWVRPSVSRDVITLNSRVIYPMFSLEKFVLVDRVCSQIRCLPIAHHWGCQQSGMCDYFPLSMEQEDHFRAILVLVGTAYILLGSWYCFERALTKSMLD